MDGRIYNQVRQTKRSNILSIYPSTVSIYLYEKSKRSEVTHPYDGIEFCHGDLFGTFHRLNDLLLMLTHTHTHTQADR